MTISGLSNAVTVGNVTTSGTTTTATLSRTIAATETGGTLSGQAGAFTDSGSPPNPCAAFSLPLSNQSTPAPTNLTATGGLTRVRLAWTGIAGSATYSVYRATASGAETLCKSGLTATSFADTGLTGGTYFYKVTATLSGSESALSNEASAAASDFTLSANPTALTVPQGGSSTSAITVTSLGGFSGTVSLAGAATVSGITAGATTASPGSSASLAVSVAKSVPPSTYTLTVTGTDSTGTVSRTAVINLTVTSLVPSNLTAVGGLTRVKLTWTGVGGNPTYNIYRWTSPGPGALCHSGGTATSYTDSGLTGGVNCSYWVSATASGSESALSNSASATVTDFTLPASAAVTVLAGGSATTKVTVSPLGGFAGAVSFSGGASGISVTGTASSPAAPATLTISAPSSVVPGTYTLVVTASAGDATGSVSHTLPLTVVVTPPPVVSIPPGSAWQPNPALVGQTITSTVSTSVSNPYQAPNGDTVTQTWAWTTGSVYMSATGAPGSFGAASNYSISWSPGSPTSQFSGSFINPGYYIVGVTATLTYYDNTTGQSFGPYSGSGYIGGSASDLAASGNTATSPLASGSQAVQPQATGTVDGIGVLPLTIGILGTNNPAAGDYRALTGQQIAASVVLPAGYSSGTKITGYTWSFSNNNPIKGWDPNAPGDGQPTQILPLLPTDYVGYPPTGSTTVSVQPILFYDEIANDTVTVKCAITLQFPDHTTQTVNAASPPVTFIKPTVGTWNVATGYVRRVINPATLYYGYGLEPTSNSNGNNGEAWSNVTINVPSPFLGGQGCFAQLITPNITVTNVTDPTQSYADPGNGQQGLDNSFPYRNYTWTVPAAGASADGPAFVFSAYNSTGFQGFSAVAVSGKFTTWVMYMPPAAVSGQGTIWVPLQSYSWSYSYTSDWINTQTNDQWPLTTSNPTAGNDPGYKPTGVMNFPPQWNTIQTNAH